MPCITRRLTTAHFYLGDTAVAVGPNIYAMPLPALWRIRTEEISSRRAPALGQDVSWIEEEFELIHERNPALQGG